MGAKAKMAGERQKQTFKNIIPYISTWFEVLQLFLFEYMFIIF